MYASSVEAAVIMPEAMPKFLMGKGKGEPWNIPRKGKVTCKDGYQGPFGKGPCEGTWVRQG